MTGDRCRVERTVELLNSSLCVVLLYMKSHVVSQGGWWGVSIEWLKKQMTSLFFPSDHFYTVKSSLFGWKLDKCAATFNLLVTLLHTWLMKQMCKVFFPVWKQGNIDRQT